MMQQIINKTFKVGEKLPSENMLADKYKVPRTSIRRALSRLEERGFIYSKRGIGRYVKNESFQVELVLDGGKSFTEKMKQSGFHLETKNICCEQVEYDPQLYERLAAEKEDEVYQISRLRFIEKEPIALHTSYMNRKIFPDIDTEGSAIRSMFSYYRQLGFRQLKNRNSLLSVTFPTLKEQELLSCKSMEPLIMIESICVDDTTETILESTKVLYRSNKFKYNIPRDS